MSELWAMLGVAAFLVVCCALPFLGAWLQSTADDQRDAEWRERVRNGTWLGEE